LLRNLHGEYGVYDQCKHQHLETDVGTVYIDGVGWTCDDGLVAVICRHCCTHKEQVQTEDCATDHSHLPDRALCPTMAIVEGLDSPWNP
jgi:hypothetical protein